MKTLLSLTLIMAAASFGCRTSAGPSAISSSPSEGVQTLTLIDTKSETPSVCSAVLIAPDIALTAAHCFQGLKGPAAVAYTPPFPGKSMSVETKVSTIQHIYFHAQYAPSEGQVLAMQDKGSNLTLPFMDPDLHDVALIFLDHAPPESYIPITLEATPLTSCRTAYKTWIFKSAATQRRQI